MTTRVANEDDWEYTVESYPEGVGLHVGRIRGECPACGVSSLFVGCGGYLTCGWLDCPNPVAPSEALGVTFKATSDG
jgi:hypothetical protein